MYMSSSKAGIIFDSIRTPVIRKIISGIESDGMSLNELDLIRLVYVRLGKYLSFNSKYRYLMSAQAQLKEESNAWKATTNATFDRITSNAICIDIESLFNTILTEMYEIPSEIIIDGSGPHVYLTIKTSDYGRIYCDLQQDLFNIKLGRKTQYFASTDFYNGKYYSKISDDELYLIDKKIQYIDEAYSNEVFEATLAKELGNITNAVDTARIFFQTVSKVYGDIIVKTGYCEASEAYKALVKENVQKLNMIHRTLRTQSHELMSYFSLLQDDNTPHYFLGNKTMFNHVEVDMETIAKLEEENKAVHRGILNS